MAMKVPVHTITRHASRITGISVRGILERSRYKEMVRCRFAIAAVAREQGWSFPHIARMLNMECHTSIRYAVEQAAVLAERDKLFSAMIGRLRGAVHKEPVQFVSIPEPKLPEPEWPLVVAVPSRRLSQEDRDGLDTDGDMRAAGTAALLAALRDAA